MGFAIVYRATGMVNFAQGEVMMLIAYISFSLARIPGIGFPALLVLVLVASVLLGLLIERLFIRPMLGEPMFSRVMVTIGLAVVIRSGVILIWGVEPMQYKAGIEPPLIFFDGTVWRDDELIAAGLGTKTGQRMGHIAMSGAQGAIAQLTGLDAGQKLFLHINNSNPALLHGSAERKIAEDAGWQIPADGTEIVL